MLPENAPDNEKEIAIYLFTVPVWPPRGTGKWTRMTVYRVLKRVERG
jgi:hypothetical protein